MPVCDTVSPNNPEPLVVKPKTAWQLLACSKTRGYELLAAGVLDSFLDGRSRKITVASIRRYIEQRLRRTAQSPSLARRDREVAVQRNSRDD